MAIHRDPVSGAADRRLGTQAPAANGRLYNGGYNHPIRRPVSLLQRASFFVSAARLDQLPPAGAPEVAFVGRSNAGKSTAINVLCNQRRLAFSSKTPGRTRLINMFDLPDPLNPEQPLGFLVDLPGYGYASVAVSEKEKWADVLGGYLRDRSSLAGIVLLIDIRRGVTDLDRRLADFIAPTGRPVLALLTKADKLPYGQRVRTVFAVRKQLADIGALHTVPFSATERIGLEEASAQIENWISPKVVP
ncbi:ribosome biogenesis GTP-binding protein YsxC [Bordetella trematum]|uniref:Probable GTP-binding protein EngB n=1 Tax=Bordetella trematum TaxID=123899 RepID=A0A157RI69_9BORD|nr:ribosome biogenesis GTP-binding protein YsxC [Bordetella trematum]SAI60334.1 ribosome biogenesis GTP-binding protein YsxC [Bordetella trematum]SAI68486.1 ribosome biogenesis GTP-binding protein YsxC [Bordetella trematum]SUV99980.1 ribosome biogenesis GTP-binding protein YsxC [Bordetella trematum]